MENSYDTTLNTIEEIHHLEDFKTWVALNGIIRSDTNSIILDERTFKLNNTLTNSVVQLIDEFIETKRSNLHF